MNYSFFQHRVNETSSMITITCCVIDNNAGGWQNIGADYDGRERNITVMKDVGNNTNDCVVARANLNITYDGTSLSRSWCRWTNYTDTDPKYTSCYHREIVYTNGNNKLYINNYSYHPW